MFCAREHDIKRPRARGGDRPDCDPELGIAGGSSLHLPLANLPGVRKPDICLSLSLRKHESLGGCEESGGGGVVLDFDEGAHCGCVLRLRVKMEYFTFEGGEQGLEAERPNGAGG